MIAASMLLTGCGGSIEGKYYRDNSSRTLVLKKNGAFRLSTGGTGSYSVNGSKIIISNPVFGGTHGVIKNNQLIFPPASSDNIVGDSFEGTWSKKQN